MEPTKTPFKVTAVRFLRAVRMFLNSAVGTKARLMFMGLFVFFGGISALNVVNSYVGRNFMTAIADRNTTDFGRQAIFYISVFAASTVVAVFARFTEERLALLWRDFLTRRAINLYLSDSTYYHLDASGQLTYPDQRISDDIRAFTTTTLSFILMVLNSGLTIFAFSGVLWSISPLLFVVAVLYAACGSYLTFVLGRPLIQLNYNQLDKEASFRSGLIHVREKAEAIMVARSEEQQAGRLLQRLEGAIANFRQITSINRNVGFFTTGYNWMIQIIPALIVAPVFFRGEVEFGVITQSAAAFALLVGAFSLIVTQFQSISNFAAVVSRLSSLQEAIEKSNLPPVIEIADADRRLAFENLTLLSSDGSPLVNDLSITVDAGTRVLVTGNSPAAGPALFKATVGVPMTGSGRILRPRRDDILFLSQHPYLSPGTLRQTLMHGGQKSSKGSDDRILQLLHDFGVREIIDQAGGLDVEREWSVLLSLREQLLLALIRIIIAQPRFVFLDRIDAIVSDDELKNILETLSRYSISYLNVGAGKSTIGAYDAVLNCGTAGRWTFTKER